MAPGGARTAPSCRVTVVSPTPGRPAARAKKRPAGWSPFAGIARIRSLGVAVQPLRCPASQPSRRDSGYPAVGAVQLPRSPRRQYRRCTARRTGAQGRKPRHARAERRVPGASSNPDPAPYPVPSTAFLAASPDPPRLRAVRVSGGNPRPRATAAFMLPRSRPQDHLVAVAVCGLPRTDGLSRVDLRQTGYGTR